MRELTGSKSWITTKAGKRKCKASVAGKYLGLFDSEAEADVVIEARISDLRSRQPKTCRDYAPAWFKAREESGLVRNIKADKSCWKTHMESAAWLDMEPNAVTATHLQQWVEDLSGRTCTRAVSRVVDGERVTECKATSVRLSGPTIRRTLGRAKVFFKWLRAKGHRSSESRNPAVDLIVPRGRKQKRRGVQRVVHLTAEEIETLFAQPLPLETRAIYAVAIYAGLRAGEIWGLRWQYVDLKGKRLLVRASGNDEVKTATSLRNVTMLPFCEQALHDYWQSLPARTIHGLVFPAIHGGCHTTGFDAQWTDTHWHPRSGPELGMLKKRPGWRTKAGLREEVTFHCFRHTYACQMLQGTVLGNAEPLTIDEVSAELGHSSIAVTQKHYAEFGESAIRAKVLGARRAPGKVETKVKTRK